MHFDDRKRVAEFLGALLNGAADLGFAALPLLGLYKKAKDEKLDFWLLVLSDESLSSMLVRKMREHAARLPPSFVAALKLVIQARNEAEVQAKAHAQATADTRPYPAARQAQNDLDDLT